MTLANRLTLIRLALVPAFMSFMIYDNLWTRAASLVIFIGASITDWYDGSLARRTGTVTLIGTFLDPLVDKMLIAAALIGFVELKELNVPAWMVVIIISREFLITGLRTLAASRGIVMAAEKAGKWKTAFQMTAVITSLVILIANAAMRRWPHLQLTETSGWQSVLRELLQQTPHWLVLWVTLFTAVSGYMYIRKYRELLRQEFAMRKIQQQKRRAADK
jgi:CDP-diacylglycerol---glycerol-3-phosphate 3-phosphatidyltransferase